MRSLVRTAFGVLAACIAAGLVAAQDPAVEVVAGRVFDASWSPLGGARVAVYVEPEAGFTPPTTAELFAAAVLQTGGDGRFQLTLAPAVRRHVLVVAAPGHATVEVPVDRPDLTVVLPEGGALVGSVRDADGALLAGVEVVVEDGLRQARPIAGLVERRAVPRVRGRTDHRGLFRLDGALRAAARLTFSRIGYASATVGPYAFGEPLVVEMHATGVLRGRILDADGRPVVATVRTEGARPVRSAADGAFEVGVPESGAFRVVCEATVDGRLQKVDHGPLDGPRDGLVLTLERPAADEVGAPLRVEVRLVDSGAAAPVFRAAVSWNTANQNQIAEMLHREVAGELVDGVDGVVELPAPGPGRPAIGTLLVGAPGYAWARVDGVEWSDDPAAPPLRVELRREVVLRGRIVDPDRGAGIAGARVGWLPHSGGRMRYARAAHRFGAVLDPVRSGTDGGFELRGVPVGPVEVLVEVPGRAAIEPLSLDLVAGEVRGELIVESSAGSPLRGKVGGLGGAGGHRIAVRQLQVDAGRLAATFAVDAAVVGADGRFSFDGLPRGFYVFDLIVPREPRAVFGLRIPLETLRIRGGGAPRTLEVDVGADLPGWITGRVAVRGGALPRSRLAVVVEDEGRQLFVNRGYARGPLALVGSGGGFSSLARAGSQRLRVFDIATGVEVGRVEGVKVAAGEATEVEVDLRVVPLQVRFADNSSPAALREARVELVVDWPPPAWSGFAVVHEHAGSSNDSGVGVTLQRGRVPVSLFIPPLPTTVRVWKVVDPTDDTKRQDPLAEQDLEPEFGRRAEVELTVRDDG